MRIPFRLLLAHARRRKLRTLLTAGSVFVAILIFGFLRTFVEGMEAAAAATDPHRLVVSSAISLFAHVPKRLEPELRAREHVRAVNHWTWYGGIWKEDAPEQNFWARFGVDVPTFREVYSRDIEVAAEVWEKLEKTRTGCIIGEGLMEDFGFKIGDVIPIRGNLFLGRLELLVVGSYKPKVRSFDAKTLFFHWDYMNEESQKEGGRADVVSTYTLVLDRPEVGAEVAQAIDESYESSDHRTLTLTERQFQAQFNSMWGNVPLFFKVLGTVVLVACLMVTANTMVLNARERIQEVGVLKTLGFTPLGVGLTTLIEGLLLCIAGGALALAFVKSLDGKMLMFVIAAVPPSTILQGLGLSVLLGLLSGIVPAWIASRMDIVEAIRRSA